MTDSPLLRVTLDRHEAAKALGIGVSCERCGTQFVQSDHFDRPRRFCSRACSAAARLAPRPSKTCLRCGSSFLPRGRGAILTRRLYCSRACYAGLQGRLTEKIDRSGGSTACWPFMGARHGMGYGTISVNGRVELAHRVAWQEVNGPIPVGLQVCHHCDNPPCCNPAHLFLGTAKDNGEDKSRKGRARGDPDHYGENTGTAKVTAADIPVIRRLYAERRPLTEIARQFGVTTSTVRRIGLHQSWRHIP